MSIMKNNLVEVPWAHNIENIFKYFDIYHEIILHFEKTCPGFVYNLDYEKLVSEPEAESKKLMSFCDLPWDKKCLEFYKRKDLISKTASNIQIREAIYKNSAEKYLPYKNIEFKKIGRDKRNYIVNFNKVKKMYNFNCSMNIDKGIKEIIFNIKKTHSGFIIMLNIKFQPCCCFQIRFHCSCVCIFRFTNTFINLIFEFKFC